MCFWAALMLSMLRSTNSSQFSYNSSVFGPSELLSKISNGIMFQFREMYCLEEWWMVGTNSAPAMLLIVKSSNHFCCANAN